MQISKATVQKYEEIQKAYIEAGRIEDGQEREKAVKTLKEKYSQEERNIMRAIQATEDAGLEVLCMDDQMSSTDIENLIAQLRTDGFEKFIITESSTSLKEALCKMLLAGCKVGMPIEIVKTNRFKPIHEMALVIEL